jgi:hypothetical protein
MRKILKSIITLTIILSIFGASAIGVCAEEAVHTLQDTPPTLQLETRGKNPPSSSASTHNLTVSSYNYQVLDVGAQVFTDKWLTGVTKIKVSVENWELLESYYGATNNKLTINVYDTNENYVTGQTITISNSVGSTTLSGLNSGSKYFIRFSVPLNENRYKFNGTISKV